MIKSLEKLAKKNPVLLDELAHAYLESGMNAKAIKLIDKYLTKFPKSVTGLMVKALSLEALGEFDKAEAIFREILAREPRNIRAVSRLAFLENDKNNPSDYWKKTLTAIDPLNPWIQAVWTPNKAKEAKTVPEPEKIAPAPPPKPVIEPPAPPEIEPVIEPLTPPAEEPVAQEEIRNPFASLADDEIPTAGKDFLEPLEFNERLLKDLEELERDELTPRPPQEMAPPAEPAVELQPPVEIVDTAPQETPVPDQNITVSDPEPTIAEQLKNVNITDEELSALFEEKASSPAKPPAKNEELEKVYQEINISSGERKNIDSFKSAGMLKTATIAQIYIQQGKLQEALEIFNSLPDGQRDEHLEEIQWLQKRLLDGENGAEAEQEKTE